MTDSYNILQGNVCTLFDISFQKDHLWETSLSKGFLPSFCVCGPGAGEDDCVFFPRLLSSWRKLQVQGERVGAEAARLVERENAGSEGQRSSAKKDRKRLYPGKRAVK